MPKETEEIFDLQVMLLGDGADDLGVLVLVAPSKQEIQRFVSRLVEITFPPGGTSESVLSVDNRNRNRFFYAVSSGAGRLAVELAEVFPGTGALVANTLNERGSLPILFGVSTDEGVQILRPSQGSFYRTSAEVDGVYISGSSDSWDWTPFMTEVESSFELFDLAAQS